MNSQNIIYLVVGLAIGAVVSGTVVSTRNKAVAPAPSPKVGMHDMSMMQQDGMTMTDMINSLKGKSGDELDKAFIAGMIEHHQGAIDMANQVKTNAKHDEVKKMADDIISAQTNEINQMKTWQKEWGY